MFQNILHFLLNWPVPMYYATHVIDYIFILANIIYLIILLACSPCFFEMKFTKRKLFFFLVLGLLLPVSTLLYIGLITAFIVIVTIFVLIFDDDNNECINSIKDFFYSIWNEVIIIIKFTRNKYCLKCKNIQIQNDNIKKCTILDIEFSRDECPCEGKLFEKE